MSVVETTLADEVVANGAAFLDEHEPGWRDRIDPEKLDLQDCNQCILGQLHGFYQKAPYPTDDPRFTSGLGFEAGFLVPDYAELTEAWRRIL